MRGALGLLAILLSAAAVGMPAPAGHQVLRAERSDVSAPLTLLTATARDADEDEREEEGPRRVPHEVQAAPPARDPVLQASVAPLLLPRTASSFDGIGAGFAGVNGRGFEVWGVPPDPQGDVGPAHYVQIVNASFVVFGKDGRALLGPVPTRTLFAGFGGDCETRDDGDGIALYDPLADRWLIAQFAIGKGADRRYHECVAVSRTADPTGQWARYDYAYADFHDYPKFGVWPDGYYVTYNTFATSSGGSFNGIAYCALDRVKMLAAAPAAQQCIVIHDDVSGITPADLDGPVPPPAGEPNTAVGFRGGALMLYRFRADWSGSFDSYIEPVALPVAPFAEACFSSRSGACIPQAGTEAPALDAIGDRIMFRAAYRNLGGRDALVVNHSVMVGNVTGVRWYEIRQPGGTPVLVQQGTYAPDDSFRWMGSAAMDRSGNIGLGFSISSAAMRPSIGYTGHAASDPPGEMGRGEAIALAGGGSQAATLRWGDYSSMSVDPEDECTFWYTNEYIPADGIYNWRTRIFTFSLPGCATSPEHAIWPKVSDQVVRRGSTTTIELQTAALRPGAAEKAISLAVAGLPPGLSARIDPPVVSPGQPAILTLTAATDAEPGRGQGYSISATGPDGIVASGSGVLDVVDSDFSLQPDRAEVFVAAGGKSRVRIDTAAVSGPAETVSLSVSGIRSGIASTFEPQQIVAGESATLVLAGVSGPFRFGAALTVTAEAASTTHTAIVHARAVEAPRVEITWPGQADALRGNAHVLATAVTSPVASLVAVELLVDGRKMPGASASASPAVLTWDTRSVADGKHRLVVRATDTQGGTGDSLPVSVTVDNQGGCGCSSRGGGWESLGLLALAAAIRRRRP